MNLQSSNTESACTGLDVGTINVEITWCQNVNVSFK